MVSSRIPEAIVVSADASAFILHLATVHVRPTTPPPFTWYSRCMQGTTIKIDSGDNVFGAECGTLDLQSGEPAGSRFPISLGCCCIFFFTNQVPNSTVTRQSQQLFDFIHSPTSLTARLCSPFPKQV